MPLYPDRQPMEDRLQAGRAGGMRPPMSAQAGPPPQAPPPPPAGADVLNQVKMHLAEAMKLLATLGPVEG